MPLSQRNRLLSHIVSTANDLNVGELRPRGNATYLTLPGRDETVQSVPPRQPDSVICAQDECESGIVSVERDQPETVQAAPAVSEKPTVRWSSRERKRPGWMKGYMSAEP